MYTHVHAYMHVFACVNTKSKGEGTTEYTLYVCLHVFTKCMCAGG